MTGIQLFGSSPEPCPYLPDRDARFVYTAPDMPFDPRQSSLLNLNNFRRSGRLWYRPECEGCRACRAVRLDVQAFRPGRTLRKLARKHDDIDIYIESPDFSEEVYHLYEQYISHRHQDGGMYPPSRSQFRQCFVAGHPNTRFMTFRKNDCLVAVAVTDWFEDGLSAVYTFFDERRKSDSLGNFCILAQISHARSLGLPWLYLGYWVKGAPKMDYKRRFKPLEVWSESHWEPLQ